MICILPFLLRQDEFTCCVAYRSAVSLGTMMFIITDFYLRPSHKRAAFRILKLCNKLGGVYIKAAQHASTLTFIPNDYQILSLLQDQAEPLKFKEIQKIIRDEIGDNFEEFSETPIAAASLGQVHYARTYSGLECAVKVQYPHVRRNFFADVVCLRAMAKITCCFFPDIQLHWFVREFVANMVTEFDFQKELMYSKLASNLCSFVYVPKVYNHLSTSRVLTMEYIKGKKILNLEESEQKIIRKHLLYYFALVFKHGFLHCDPHPGNFLVRKYHSGVQLVVLDHGMYRYLSHDFRKSYICLWKGILTKNKKLIETSCADLQCLDFANNVNSFFAGNQQPIDFYLGLRFMESVSRDMVLTVRAMNLISSIYRMLGGTDEEKFCVFQKFWKNLNFGEK